ncbi:MSHA biogenesis protein MshK [Thalassotalea psychrophila]|uniref:MSHA biogenesis protein MshK n=1 Tax=Thalassotalea psychrophila TaxID=3065647 RepID=A0ABY9TWK3_9GAMM|nr:MSHA biogenesis protein MshK [Colwelliaceae bacterium SQ149]
MFKIFLLTLLTLFSLNINAEQLDPTKPFSKSITDRESVKQNLKLYSIISSGNSRKAIINKKIMVVGDSLDEFKVIKIEKQKVVLQSSSETIELVLFTNALTK